MDFENLLSVMRISLGLVGTPPEAESHLDIDTVVQQLADARAFA